VVPKKLARGVFQAEFSFSFSFSIEKAQAGIAGSCYNFSLWTKLSFCLGGLMTLFQLLLTPCKVRKLSSHQRNSKKGSFVHTSLSTALSLSQTHQSKSFSFRF
jgi:hypothetical protein